MSIPSVFIERILNQFPEDGRELLNALESYSEVSIRYNPRKLIPISNTEKVVWSQFGYYLNHRPVFTLDPLFHAGAYYVQEASSMVLDYILGEIKQEISLDRCLDLCAAPGGKSTIILDHLEKNQYLVANEIIPSRNQILKENLTRWGYPNFLISQNKPKDFKYINEYFDFILMDAPCSGEGMFRKDKNSREEWSLNNLNMCSARQEDIFCYIWDSLKPGGFLVYSTCTFNPEENELFIKKLLNQGYAFDSFPLNIPKSWGVREIHDGHVTSYQFLPNRIRGEGFFCSILRKTGGYTRSAKKSSRTRIEKELLKYITIPENFYSTFRIERRIYIAPNTLLDDLEYLKKHLYIRQLGIDTLELENDKWIPSHGLSMLSLIPNCNIIALDKNAALKFLKGEDLSVPLENPADEYYLVQYYSQTLGIGKYDSHKLTNKLPPHLRIRMQVD